jgi:hypothetical protein
VIRRIGAALLLVGLLMAFGSCAVFPSQFGSDYAVINAGGVMGSAIGVLLALIGAAMLAGKGGPETWR